MSNLVRQASSVLKALEASEPELIEEQANFIQDILLELYHYHYAVIEDTLAQFTVLEED